MQPPTSLTDQTLTIVADASAVISITASARADLICSAIPNRLVVSEVVVSELDSGRSKGHSNAVQLQKLIDRNLVEVATMGDEAEGHFESLVVGSARNTLDDGEAATIACALEIDGIPLLDERKARRICNQRYPKLSYGCTVDIFAHPEVEKTLGTADLAFAVLTALKESRMRVLPHHLDWVIDLIGPENAVECISLPRAVRKQASDQN